MAKHHHRERERPKKDRVVAFLHGASECEISDLNRGDEMFLSLLYIMLLPSSIRGDQALRSPSQVAPRNKRPSEGDLGGLQHRCGLAVTKVRQHHLDATENSVTALRKWPNWHLCQWLVDMWWIDHVLLKLGIARHVLTTV